MASGAKSFVINRKEDWEENGIIQNFSFQNDELILLNKDGKNGFFISTAIDSLENETVWNRMKMDMSSINDAIVRVRFYASDSLKVEIERNAFEKKEVLLDKYIKDDSVPFNERFNVLGRLDGVKKFDNPSDVLLYSLKGRYLWFSIEVISYSDTPISIRKLLLEFPRISFVEYLPEIYQNHAQKDSFFARFLGVFQSIYLELEEKIDNMPKMFDPMLVNSDFLKWMTQWFSIRDSYIWSEDKLRTILKNIVRLYKIKGTRNSIIEIVYIYTGCKAKIIEQFEIINNEFFTNNKQLLQNLFGKNGYTFTIIIDEKSIEKSDEYVALMKLINLFKPADAKCNLVSLTNNIYLDYHCYLGINSYIAHNNQMVLNKNSIIMNSTFLSE